MQFTLKTAKKRLVESSNAYGQNDLRDIVNNAIQHLSTMAGWERLRRVLRFCTVGPHFVLPQGCAGIVRACVNGRPTTVRAQDFRFLHSGPGEMARPPSGFCFVRASNIIDAGMKPVMFEPMAPFRVFATAPHAGGTGSANARIVVKGISPAGEFVQVVLSPAPESDGPSFTGVVVPATVFQNVTEVTLDGTDEYVTLYAEDVVTEVRWPIAVYNPFIEAPEFRHYDIRDVNPGQPIELLVECRIDPVPLVEDTDVVMLPSFNPIEWVVRGDWQMKAGETEAAQKYYSMAANWLKALEVVETTEQTSIVVNSVFDNSLGEVSMESVNI